MDTQIHGPVRVRHQNPLRLIQVANATTLTPRLRRITFAGPELAGFTTLAHDDHVKLFFPAPGQDRPAMPIASAGQIVWPEATPRPVMRDYTPRRYDPQRQELTIDFVLHGLKGEAHGPAAEWAAQARPGQYLGLGGPRGSLLASECYDAYLLAGDETALPAIARRLEELRPGTPAVVLLEVADADEQCHLPTAANAAITWLPRTGVLPGRNSLLIDALRRLILPEGRVHGWVAAEIETARSLRDYLIMEESFSRADVKAAGYWRMGEAGAHATLDE